MANLDLGQFINQIKAGQNSHAMMAQALQLLQDAMNNLGQNVAANPVGNTEAPPAVQKLNVKNVGEYFHFSIEDHAPIQKGIHYFVEADTDPSFKSPQVLHAGASRTPVGTTHLPAKDDAGNPMTYYFRAYSQYPGSDPGPKVNFGGQVASGLTPSGATQFSLLQSTGSGTAAGNGQQGGSGFGTVLQRPSPGPKREIPT